MDIYNIAIYGLDLMHLKMEINLNDKMSGKLNFRPLIFVYLKLSSLITGLLCSVDQNWWGVIKLASEQHQAVHCSFLAQFDSGKLN